MGQLSVKQEDLESSESSEPPESCQPTDNVQDEVLPRMRLQILGRDNTELTQLRSEEFLAKFGNLRAHDLAAITEHPAEQRDTTVTSEYMKEGELNQPWSHDFQDEEAPEDLKTPQPSNFDVPLAYMNKTLGDATTDFFNMIVTRVSEALSGVTSVVENLKGKYLPVFVPHNWLGITGIPSVVIKVTPDIPLSRKPKARPVNPKMMGHVFKEFTRLSGYFYVPSTSPWASCFVIAAKKTEPFVDSVVTIGRLTNTTRLDIHQYPTYQMRS